VSGGELDEETVRALAAGDPQALARCFRAHGARIWRVARGILGQAADADDATQEIFLRVRDKAAGFDGRGSFSAWLRRLAVNHCLNLLEERRRRNGRLEEVAPDAIAAGGRVPFEAEEALARALERLPSEQRAVLVLRELDGLSYREIADALSIPAGTVMSRLARARERLLGAPGGGAPEAAKPDECAGGAIRASGAPRSEPWPTPVGGDRS
jgi:RNA polymerase sigma-70 factor (ECF subfamily)